MTRGKYTQKAATRAAFTDVESRASGLAQQVHNLTAERDELARQLRDERAASTATIRALRSDRAADLAPEFAARDAVIAGLRVELAKHHDTLDVIQRNWDRVSTFFLTQRNAAGRTRDEAIEDLLELVSDSEGHHTITDIPPNVRRKLGRDGAEKISRAQGRRRNIWGGPTGVSSRLDTAAWSDPAPRDAEQEIEAADETINAQAELAHIRHVDLQHMAEIIGDKG